MRMVDRGAPALVKRDGKYRLEIPIDFEFDNEAEARSVENALKEAIAERLERIKSGR
jgi:hypothetical protein